MKKWSYDLPHITKKQEEIMEYVYKFRFLDRIQLQRLIKHKDYKRINVYLKDLVEKGYLYRIYVKKIPFNIKPAVYYLAPIGIRFTRRFGIDDHSQTFYKDNIRSESFKEKCMIIANLYLDLRDKTETLNVLNYFKTKQDFDKEYEDEEIFKPFPDIAISLKTYPALIQDYLNKKISLKTFNLKAKLNSKGKTNKQHLYLMEIIGEAAPRYYLRHRIKQYIEDSDYKGDLGIYQTVCFILPNNQTQKFVQKFITKTLEETLFEPHLKFATTTIDLLKQHGIIAGIWKEIK